ncbi:class I SAM-dependent methyltransferase [Cognatazoarcus halotolerans]|uniref:class I SAM-dependent methyltransferase n=1 Tax=Cognatazoarcus halotolerans TaxID=2686016 RepID=UPI001358DEAD|nr:class I SAM-dependent methyltransferase [Cognatazoarcus halotolerans]MCP5310699.1 methyltransferase domain-containing protein [Zoogloeaceae bacterium]
MDKSEFDRFAEEYRQIHARNIGLSGESPEFFARYKVQDVANLVCELGLPGPSRILDFGAGVGNSIPHFRQQFPEASIYCADVSHASLKIAAERFAGSAALIQFDGETLPMPAGSFELIFSACVFHHIPKSGHEGLLRELLRVLAPGGVLIIFEHNPFNPLTLHAVNTCPFDENAVLLRPRELCDALRQGGFTRVIRHYRLFFPGALRRLRAFERFLTWLPLGAQYFVAARKPSASGPDLA